MMSCVVVTTLFPNEQAHCFPSCARGRQLHHPCITWKHVHTKRNHKGSKELDHAPNQACCWSAVPSSLLLAFLMTSKTSFQSAPPCIPGMVVAVAFGWVLNDLAGSSNNSGMLLLPVPFTKVGQLWRFIATDCLGWSNPLVCQLMTCQT